MDEADGLEAAVSRWAADEEARELARIRASTRRLAEQAALVRDLPDALRQLAADGLAVRLTTGPGRSHRGVLRAVGEDFVALATERAWGLVALRALAMVGVDVPALPATGSSDPGTGSAAGSGWAAGPDWAERPPARLSDAVERLAGRDLPVRVHTTGDTLGVVGELGAPGADHLVLACDADQPRRAAGTVYVPLGSLAELWLLLRSG